MSAGAGRTVCAQGMCAACMACLDSCGHGAITIHDSLDSCNAVIDAERCVSCGACERVCPQVSPVSLREPIEWRQGWAANPDERAASSSGGLATAISRAFMARGGLVCSCTQEGGDFGFRLTDDPADLERMRGSKYVKSNPAGAHRKVRDALRSGRDVLFVGLPCQVAAARGFAGRLGERLYTVDLICHGTPSADLLRRYLRERGDDLRDELILDFRKKVQYQLRWRGAGTGLAGRGMDCYTVAFLEGMSYTENCYSCPYARLERASDVTLGDSWGTELAGEKAAGVSLALANTEKGRELLERADLVLLPVDRARALETNGQLSRPTQRPGDREAFFGALAAGKTVNAAVFEWRPWLCVKRTVKGAVKGFLIDHGLLR